jgi:hypothetical protein
MPQQEEQRKKRERAVKRAVGAVLILAVISALFSIVSFVQESLSAKEAGKVFNSERLGKGEVAGRAWVEPAALKPGEPLRCWIRLENLTGGPVTGLRFDLAEILPRPGASASGDFAAQLNRELAASLPRPPAPGDPRTLGPGHTVSFWTALRFPEPEDQYEIDLVYSWTQRAQPTQEGQTGENRLLIGPIDVVTPGERRARIGAAVYGVGKDLALPIAVAVLTFLLSRFERDYERLREKAERDRETAEKARDEARKEAEKHTQQARETWGRMLVISHRDAKRFYLPLLSALRELRDKTGEPTDKSEREKPLDWQDQAFYWAMMFLRNMKRLKDENGGFYLKTRHGEDLLSDIWFMLKRAFQKEFGPETYDAALDDVGHADTYATFRGRLSGSTALTSCRTKFLNGLKPPDGFVEIYVPLLSLFYYVLRYEANLAYLYWYGEPEKPPNLRLKENQNFLMKGPLAKELGEKKINVKLVAYRRKIVSDYHDLRAKLGGSPLRPESPQAAGIR